MTPSLCNMQLRYCNLYRYVLAANCTCNHVNNRSWQVLVVEQFYEDITTCSPAKKDIAYLHDRTIPGAHRKQFVGNKKRVVCVFPDKCKVRNAWIYVHCLWRPGMYRYVVHKYWMFSTHPVRLTQYTSKSSRVRKCTQCFCNASRTCPMWSPILCLIRSNHFGCMMHKLSKFYLWTFFNYSPEHSLVVCMPRKRLTPMHVQGGYPSPWQRTLKTVFCVD